MATTIDLPDLAAALEVENGELISLVGGGGKTTTLFTLGRQLRGTTVLTTTTKMGSEQSSDYPLLVNPTDPELTAGLDTHERVLVWKAADGRRAIGMSGQTCDRWFDLADNLVVEADGSRKRPFKAPAAHEPVIPSRTTLLVACIGASAFGQPIEHGCHRPELVAALADCEITDLLTPTRAAAVLLSSQGSQKDRPASARLVVALHRVDATMQPFIDALDAELGDGARLLAIRQKQ